MIISLELNQSKNLRAESKIFDDYGVISIMYHRFNEKKYPSTNIELNIFKKQLNIIESEGLEFINP